MKPIRICYCIDDLTGGGAQQVVRYLATGLNRQRFQPVVCAFKGGIIEDAITQEGVPVQIFKRNIRKFDIGLVYKLKRYFEQERFDIVHTHLFGATLHGMIAAKAAAAMLKVVTLHSDREDNWLQRAGYHFLFPRTACVIGVSHESSRVLIKRYTQLQQKLITIPNGIRTELFAKRSDKKLIRKNLNFPLKKRIVGTIGRLSVEKGHDCLIEAFARVQQDIPEAHLIIIGEGQSYSAVQSLRDKLKLDGNVQFLGVRKDIPEVLGAMDIFVLSSQWEGLPLVLLEAMAAGIPVVATRVGGIPEVVRHQREGLIVPAARPDLLATAIVKILSDASFAQRLATNALHKIQSTYSVTRMLQMHEKLYQLLCAGQRPPGDFNENSVSQNTAV